MADEGRVTRQLRDLSERAVRLEDAAATSEPERAGWWLDAVTYLFVTAIEVCIDVSQHIVASEDLGVPSTNADAIRRLGEHGAIQSDLGQRLALTVGFRNVLVHGYVEVDDRIVVASLHDVADLHAFVCQVPAWLLTRGT